MGTTKTLTGRRQCFKEIFVEFNNGANWKKIFVLKTKSVAFRQKSLVVKIIIIIIIIIM